MSALLLVLSFPEKMEAAYLSNPDPNIVIYFVPHADDETLTFSVPILNDLRAGKKVYLVLMSHGELSVARDVINGVYDQQSPYGTEGTRVYCKWHGRYHDPLEEGYSNLSLEEFGNVRVQDFYRSAQMLGIPTNRIKVMPLPNEQFTYTQVHSLFRRYAQWYPNAELKTMSQADRHKDHAMAGKVLNDMYRRGEIKKRPTFFVSVYTDRFSGVHVPGYQLYLSDPSDTAKVLKAIEVYKTWNPTEGYFGTGYHSVPSQFDSMESNIYTKVSKL